MENDQDEIQPDALFDEPIRIHDVVMNDDELAAALQELDRREQADADIRAAAAARAAGGGGRQVNRDEPWRVGGGTPAEQSFVIQGDGDEMWMVGEPDEAAYQPNMMQGNGDEMWMVGEQGEAAQQPILVQGDGDEMWMVGEQAAGYEPEMVQWNGEEGGHMVNVELHEMFAPPPQPPTPAPLPHPVLPALYVLPRPPMQQWHGNGPPMRPPHMFPPPLPHRPPPVPLFIPPQAPMQPWHGERPQMRAPMHGPPYPFPQPFRHNPQGLHRPPLPHFNPYLQGGPAGPPLRPPHFVPPYQPVMLQHAQVFPQPNDADPFLDIFDVRLAAGERRDDREERRRRRRAARGHRVTEEMIAAAAEQKQEDESNPSTTIYSRVCPICDVKNSRQRAVYAKCGHIICFPCAVQIARNAEREGLEDPRGKCPFCRAPSDFVRLYEDEHRIDAN